jgi:poly(A) polymerase
VNKLVFTNEYIKEISKLTQKKIYIVGNAVRDYLTKKEIVDFDIVTLEEIYGLAHELAHRNNGRCISLDKENGRVRVVLDNDDNKGTVIDFCTMNGKDIYEDLSKRDFTINAMAIEVKDEKADFGDVIDPYGGLKDIKNRIIKEVDENVYLEDPVRLIGAVRLMAELNFDMSDNTLELIKRNSYRIKEVSGERIGNELFKILAFKRSYYYFNFMDKHLTLLGKIFPEIEPMKNVGRCKYHVVDSWTHSLHTMKTIEKIIYADGYFEDHLRKAYEKHTSQIMDNEHARIQLIKLAALFHDIGKPKARWVDETGRVRFKGHEIAGEEIMADISDRLRLKRIEKKFLCKIVREHMWPLTLYKTNDVSGRALYDLFKNFGESTLDIILIGLADIISTRQLLKPHEEMGMYKVHAEYLANNYLTRFRKLEDISSTINGNDILKNFEIEDKTIIGELIDSVKKAIFFGKIPLEKERILTYIEECLI